MRITAQQRDAHLVRTHRSHINLAAFTPMDLDGIGPWRDAPMPPKSVAKRFVTCRIQPRPAPRLRILAVGCDHPPSRNIVQRSDTRSPPESHAHFSGSFHE